MHEGARERSSLELPSCDALRADQDGCVGDNVSEASEDSGWETQSEVSEGSWESLSDSCSSGTDDGTPSAGLLRRQQLTAKERYLSKGRLLRLDQDVSSCIRQVSATGRWPEHLHLPRGHYFVGPSREELVLFQRKQSLFLEIRSLLECIEPLTVWFPYWDLLEQLRKTVFKQLNTCFRGVLSAEQIYLLRYIAHLQGCYIPPSVVEKSSIRATPSDRTLGYISWTSCPKAVMTRY